MLKKSLRVFIVGGTSGIGAALAKDYEQNGHDVAICGRYPDKCDPSVSHLKKFKVDVRHKEQLEAGLQGFLEGDIDLLFYCAGVYFNDEQLEKDHSLFDQMLSTNVQGASHCFDLCLKYMNKGQVVTLSSVSSFFNNSEYAKSKSELNKLCELRRNELQQGNIHLLNVKLGYVDTEKLRELNNGDLSKKVFVIYVQVAVDKIKLSLSKGLKKVVIPWQMKFLSACLLLFPMKIRNYLLKGY
jgi:NADP-dependent 3-hydroxy acid dehydrogenase YdfG